MRNSQKNYKAFTLSEVMITLGILGVVIAMTLPVLMSKYRKQEVSARLKKFYTIMNQAIMMSELENGDIKYWEIEAAYTTDDGSYDYNVGGENCNKFFNRYLAKYIKYYKLTQGYSKENDDGTTSSELSKIYFFDGSTSTIKQGTCIDFGFDINGDKKPNKNGEDKFYFFICPNDKGYRLYATERFSTIGQRTINTHEKAMEACKNSRGSCSRLIQIDGWEIKKDYPYKI